MFGRSQFTRTAPVVHAVYKCWAGMRKGCFLVKPLECFSSIDSSLYLSLSMEKLPMHYSALWSIGTGLLLERSEWVTKINLSGCLSLPLNEP